jgi:hypothetical protein
MQSVSAKDLLKCHQRELQMKRESHQKRVVQKAPSLSAAKSLVPTLGKGLGSETDVLFDFNEAPLMPAVKSNVAKVSVFRVLFVVYEPNNIQFKYDLLHTVCSIYYLHASSNNIIILYGK